MKMLKNDKNVKAQEKSLASVINPHITGPVVEPKLSPQLISPVTMPYVCKLSFWWPFNLVKQLRYIQSEYIVNSRNHFSYPLGIAKANPVYIKKAASLSHLFSLKTSF